MRLIVLGTGTGVGKTRVSCAIARALRERGVDVLALKPIESGVSADGWEASDAAALEAASGRSITPHPLYAFADPVSPHLAARRAGATLELAQVTSWAEALPPSSATLFESAGGAFSPLGPGLVNAHLVAALHAEVIVLVASDRLGALHDVTATLRALEATCSSSVPRLVVLNEVKQGEAADLGNARELEWLGITSPVFALPYGAWDSTRLRPLLETLADFSPLANGVDAD